jgi:hypothetical protein
MPDPLADRLVEAIYRNKPATASDPIHCEQDFWRGYEWLVAESCFTPRRLALLLRHRRFHTIMGVVTVGCDGAALDEGLGRLHAMLDDLHAEGLAA